MGEFFQAYRPLCVVSDLIHTLAAKRLRCTCAQEREGRMRGKSEINYCPLRMEPRWRHLKIQDPRWRIVLLLLSDSECELANKILYRHQSVIIALYCMILHSGSLFLHLFLMTGLCFSVFLTLALLLHMKVLQSRQKYSQRLQEKKSDIDFRHFQTDASIDAYSQVFLINIWYPAWLYQVFVFTQPSGGRGSCYR